MLRRALQSMARATAAMVSRAMGRASVTGAVRSLHDADKSPAYAQVSQAAGAPSWMSRKRDVPVSYVSRRRTIAGLACLRAGLHAVLASGACYGCSL